MNLKVVKIEPCAIMPRRMSALAAGIDLYVAKDQIIYSGRNVIPLYLSIELPDDCYAEIKSRSGFASKGFEGKSMVTGEMERYDCDVLLGTIDADYRGGIGIIVKNNDIPFMLKSGTRIAQMIVKKYEPCEVLEVQSLSPTTRGISGFGSTGTK